MQHRFFLLVTGLFLATLAQAQMERTMYQVFEVDSVKSAQFEILDLYELHSWAGNAILVETNIQISNASPEILDFLIKHGRYDVKMDTLAPGAVKIYTKIKDRKTVKTPAGECTELPMAKIFIPDTFIWAEDKKSVRRKE
ncbi:MAG: hypothetical protein ABIQ93_04100 [Saprospiraceae bacterium]